MNQLFRLGFVLLSNIASENLDAFVASFGPIRSNEYGSSNHHGVVHLDVAQDVAGSTYDLPAHTDLTFWYGHRVAAFIHCLQHEASGGDTFVLDGYRVANDFRQNHPDDFRLLVETPVQFCRVQHSHKYFFRPTRTIIELDWNGKIEAVRFSHKNFYPNLPFDKLERFYEAYRNFTGYVNNPKYQYRFHFQPGDCLLMQNFRVLHGRTAFDLSSGNRKIKVGYVEWDYFLASYFYKQEFG